MARKRVVFHIGYPKTGTSALQAYFSSNADALMRVGIDYPYREPAVSIEHGYCSGNVIQVLFLEGIAERYTSKFGGDTLRGSTMINAFAPDVFNKLGEIAAASPADTVLFSGEVVSTLSPQHWPVFAALGKIFDIFIVAFARDPFDYRLSAWKQSAKVVHRQAITDFDAIPERADELGAWMFGNFEALLYSGLPFTLLNYDTYRRDIVPAFFEAASLPKPVDPPFKLDGTFNSSLTLSEAILATKIAVVLGNRDFARTLVQKMVTRPDRPADQPYYSREIHAKLLEEYGPTIARMNEVIVGDRLATTLRDTPDGHYAVRAEDVDILLRALREVSGLDDPRTEWTPGTSVRNKQEEFYDEDGVPLDFDPRAYLFHNPDVEKAGMDPREHYIRHGRGEMRRYRYS